MLPPNKEAMEAGTAALVEAGVQDIEAAKVIMVADFDGGEWSQDTVAGYAYKLKGRHPELWAKPASESDRVLAELEKQAFTANTAAAATARSKLVKEIGEDRANIAARKYGLNSIGDFKRVGVAPTGEVDEKGDGKGGDDKSNKSKNPWKLPADDPAAIAARAQFIKSCGTKAAASLAKSAGVDLAGRPLRVA